MLYRSGRATPCARPEQTPAPKVGCPRSELDTFGPATDRQNPRHIAAPNRHRPSHPAGYCAPKRITRQPTKALRAPMNYSVHLTDGTVFHARTASCFRIQEDGSLTALLMLVAVEDQPDLMAGAQEALRLFRDRDPRVDRQFRLAVSQAPKTDLLLRPIVIDRPKEIGTTSQSKSLCHGTRTCRRRSTIALVSSTPYREARSGVLRKSGSSVRGVLDGKI